jgi:hypothetical protein
LKSKGILTVADSEEFVRGNLRSKAEILTVSNVKGQMTAPGSDTNSKKYYNANSLIESELNFTLNPLIA